ncbi:MAG: helix-turn-helix domain-containing protein [Candidatus Omnitrophota bacterium]
MKDGAGNFCQRLKSLRETLNLTQKEFAESIGMDPTYYSKIELGTIHPGFDFFYSTSETHRLSLNYLFTGKGAMFINERPKDGYRKYEILDQTDELRTLVWFLKNSKIVRLACLGHLVEFYSLNRMALEAELKMRGIEDSEIPRI